MGQYIHLNVVSPIMERVKVLVFVSGELWDEFYFTVFQFSSYFQYENGAHCPGPDAETLIAGGNDISRSVNPIIHHQKPDGGKSVGDPCFYQETGSTSNYWKEDLNFKQCYKTKMTGYLLSYFATTLKTSEYYRTAVINRLLRCKKFEPNKFTSPYPLKLIIQLGSPKKDVIDYNWNERMLTMALERRELDHAMSWFSTLGGAFSALGDHFNHCAVVAGKISIKQMKLALRLGDPLTVARCKLYLALSLIQRGYLRTAKDIIIQQYHFAKTSPVLDTRLIRMCQGIWARLKYAYQIKKKPRHHS